MPMLDIFREELSNLRKRVNEAEKAGKATQDELTIVKTSLDKAQADIEDLKKLKPEVPT